MRQSQPSDIVYRVCDSVEDLIDAVGQAKPHRVAHHEHWHQESWVGRDFTSWDEVYQAARQPWPEGIEVLDRMLRDLNDTPAPQPVSRRRRTRFSEDDGDEVDYDRLRSGRAFWRTSRRQNTRGPATITIVVDVCGSSCVNHRDLLWRGAAAIALTKRLEEAGYRVELWAVQKVRGLWADRSKGAGFNTGGLNAVCLKRPSEPLDTSTLISAVSGWFFRTVFFRAMCLGTWRIARRLGRPAPINQIDLDQITPDRNRMLIAGAFSYNAAVGLIRSKLTELTNS